MATDEEKISRLYKQGKEPGPTAHLDNVILRAARDAVQDDVVQGRPQAKISATARSPLFAGPFSGGWRAFASIAAVLVITVILVPLLQQEEISPTVSRVADDVSILKKEQDFISASDVKRSVAAKENTEANITAKKRSKMKVLEQENASQLFQAPAKTTNKTLNRDTQFAAEEKIAPVKTAPEISERLLSPAQKPQPASAAIGAAALNDQQPHDQQSYDQVQEPGISAEIKQQDRGMRATDITPAVTMAAKPWLQKIRQLIAQGDIDLAEKELDEFKLRYPDEDIDPSILNQLK